MFTLPCARFLYWLEAGVDIYYPRPRVANFFWEVYSSDVTITERRQLVRSWRVQNFVTFGVVMGDIVKRINRLDKKKMLARPNRLLCYCVLTPCVCYGNRTEFPFCDREMLYGVNEVRRNNNGDENWLGGEDSSEEEG